MDAPLPVLNSSSTQTPTTKPKQSARQVPGLTTPAPQASLSPARPPPPARKSVFTEIGLDEYNDTAAASSLSSDFSNLSRRPRQVRFRSHVDIHEADTSTEDEDEDAETERVADSAIQSIQPDAYTMTRRSSSSMPSMPRVFFFALLLALILPSLQNSPLLKDGRFGPIGVRGGLIKKTYVKDERAVIGSGERLGRRQDVTNICTRWSHQSTMLDVAANYHWE